MSRLGMTLERFKFGHWIPNTDGHPDFAAARRVCITLWQRPRDIGNG